MVIDVQLNGHAWAFADELTQRIKNYFQQTHVYETRIPHADDIIHRGHIEHL